MTTANKISTLWIVVLFNMGFADILSFMIPGILDEISTGVVDGITITPMFMLAAAVLIEVSILMIFLTHSLSQHASRNANLFAVVITIIFVVGGGSLTPHYVFFASIEVIAMLYIAYLAWGWPEQQPV